ncbi:hypothetical protein [Ponticaulis sp.]|uniref:hypothetical protein n=1 Tax=Ponticaulis sp. TaxID=2020902 RepID=UPI0025DBDD5A|nr:hypothetical protein [Ponticaulis sp.]
MSKIIYRGFEASAAGTGKNKNNQPLTYRGIQFTPTSHTIVNPKSGETKLLYRGVAAA